MVVNFAGFLCETRFGSYQNGDPALELVDPETGEPVARCTVFFPDRPTGPRKIFVKDWSENDGMVDALIEAKIIEPECLEVVRTGFVDCGLYSLRPEVLT